MARLLQNMWININIADEDAKHQYLDSKIHGANMGPIWGWQDHVGLT